MLSKEWCRDTFLYPASPANLARKIIEIGPGRGDFLFHLAENNKDAAIYGIEIKGKRFDKLIKRTQKRGLDNIILIQDDGRNALVDHVKNNSIEKIYINFPDPWPKKRHTKNRLMNEPFLFSCLSVLKKEGELIFTTDFKNYAYQVAELFSSIDGFSNAYSGGILTDSPEAFPTFFAQKWKAEGRTIYYQKYIKKGEL